MKLPFITKKEEIKDYFLVLLLSSGKVGALLFEKTGEKLSILGKKEEPIDAPLDTIEPNKLIESADIVISDIENGLPEGAHLEKTIFSVPQRWVEEGKIKKDHLVSLKKLCESLELTPVGFIVSIEALSSHLHKTEGVPVTAIFVEIGEKLATVSIVKNGSIIFVDEKEIEKDPITTSEEVLLTQEATEVLPSKIILLNYDNAKTIQQKFLTHAWSKSLPFLHLPQVIVLDSEVESQAIISGVASQMGFEHVEGIAAKDIAAPQVQKDMQSSEDAPLEEDQDVDMEDKKEQVEEEIPEYSGEAVGFFKEKDILKEPVVPDLDENIEPVVSTPRKEEKLEEAVPEDTRSAIPMSFATAGGILSRLKMPNIPSLGGITASGNKFYLYPIIGLILLIVFGFLYYFMFETATVTLYLDKNVVTKDMPITFSTEEQSSVEDGILQLETREITIEGEETKKATGTKKTGEKAKGEITLYNKTEGKKTFPKGSVIVGPNNLTFTLVDEVIIASTSSFSTSFSNSKGKVESSEFGKEYNLPSSTNFSIENNSTADFFAKNDQAFSGGTSKDVTVISEEDLGELDAALVNRLTKEAVAKAASDKDPEEDILDDPMDFSFNDKTYSKKEGDAASDVKLTGSITFEMGVYKKSDLLSFAKEASSKEAGNGEFSEKDSQVSVKDIETEGGETTATLVFSSVYLPKIETGDLAGKVSGKNSERTYEIIDIDGVQDTKVEFTRSLPFLPKLLPFNKNNIKIELQANP